MNHLFPHFRELRSSSYQFSWKGKIIASLVNSELNSPVCRKQWPEEVARSATRLPVFEWRIRSNKNQALFLALVICGLWIKRPHFLHAPFASRKYDRWISAHTCTRAYALLLFLQQHVNNQERRKKRETWKIVKKKEKKEKKRKEETYRQENFEIVSKCWIAISFWFEFVAMNDLITGKLIIPTLSERQFIRLVSWRYNVIAFLLLQGKKRPMYNPGRRERDSGYMRGKKW